MVDLEDRGLGFGKRIILLLETHLASLRVSSLLLGVVEGNELATAFWTRMNYTPAAGAQEQVVGNAPVRVRSFYKEIPLPGKS